ncbi:MAG: CPBP family intramembrane metalloprotease [Marinilabiliales bacterium]|nr:CPBP family intramembrane metalloprotease [Marinilabiliales bacterium]
MKKEKKGIRGWLRVLMIVIPFGLSVGLMQMIAAKALGLNLANRSMQLTTFQTFVMEMAMVAGTLLVVWFFRKFVDEASFVSLGFGTQQLKQEVVSGLVTGTLLIVIGFVTLLSLGEIRVTGFHPELSSLVISILLFVAVAFVEELLFRGYILSNLMRSMNRWIALLVSSLLFAGVHMGNAHFVPLSFFSILLAGILLGLPYVFTKSLWWPMALHFSWNFFQGTIFGFNVSGNAEYNLITQSRNGDTLLNGGAFGFEGSLLAILLLLGAAVWFGVVHFKEERRQLALAVAAEVVTPVAVEAPATED